MIQVRRQFAWYPALAAAALVVLSSGQRSHARAGCTPVSVMSPQGNGEAAEPSLSADGRFMAFDSSANNLVPGDSGFRDVFVFDRVTCAVERVSVSSGGVQGNGSSSDPAISDDGRFVAFESFANNLATDTNSTSDIFLRDRLLGTTVLVSVDSGELQPTDGISSDAEISGDGQFVIFVSLASTLVPADSNNEADVFVRDLVAGTTERVSISSSGVQGDSPSMIGVSDPALSQDGRYAVFTSQMNTLVTGDFNNTMDVFLRDRSMGTTTRLSVSTSGQEAVIQSSSPSISADGSIVAFEALSSFNLVPGDNTCDGIFIRDVALGVTSCLPLLPPTGFPGGLATDPSLSADGRFVALKSQRMYVPGDDPNSDVYVHDRQTGVTRRASTSSQGGEGNSSVAFSRPSLSADGAFVGFHSHASNLVLGDTNNQSDVFVTQWAVLPDPPHVNLTRNGGFTNGLQSWQPFATPDLSYIVTQVTNGVLEFYRQPPPPGTTNQAVVFQNTTSRFLAHAAIEARFDLGNSSSARKRITVLLHENDFSDLTACTFWLPPGAPLRTYLMRSHTTKFWSNATISFYAASAGSDGGFYQLDNVSLYSVPAQDDDRTDCVDPLAPVAPGGAAGPNLVTNGGFDSGLPPWLTFGQIVSQIANGIFEFYRPAGTPSGVVFQQTGVALAQNDILTANFYLGNSSTVRKRVSVLLHDATFADLSACTFWLPPGLPLAPYRMRTYATQAWSDATISIYPATVGADQWIQLDNVTLQTTPAASTDGTNCLEPGADIMTALQRGHRPLATAPRSATRGSRLPPGPTLRGESRQLTVVSHGAETLTVWQDRIDLTQTTSSRLLFESLMRAPRSRAIVQVSVDGLTWENAAEILESANWRANLVNLDRFAGHLVHVRILLDAAGPGDRLDMRDVRVLTSGF